MSEPFIYNDLLKYIGQIVTIFIEGGSGPGIGFTGILAGVSNNLIKLITDIAPSSVCFLCQINNKYSQCKNFNNFLCAKNNFYKNHYLGSITEIPVNKIISFTHNAI